jgi:hypothetical protein
MSTGPDRIKSFVRQTTDVSTIANYHGFGQSIDVVSAQVDDKPVSESGKHGVRQEIPSASCQDRTERPQVSEERASYWP